MPKWITKPASVETHTFDSFITTLVSDAGQWGGGMALIRRGTKVLAACEKVAPGEAFVIDDPDHALLLATMDKPSQPWNPVAMRALDSFVVAIESATAEQPVAKTPEAACPSS